MAENNIADSVYEVVDTCCNKEQTYFISFYFGFIVLCALTWKRAIVKPMRLMAVFLHEISHAIACWISCGTVRGIEVENNEGGVTKYIGGWRTIIIPAGYIGTSFWGFVFTVLSGGRISSTVAACGFIFAMLLSLCFSPNRDMVFLNLGYSLLTGCFVVIEWFEFSPILPFVILFYGVFIGTYAIGDIITDTVKRTVTESDAYACYEEYPCCLPRCVGVQWLIISILFQWLGIWLALVLMSDKCQDKGSLECIFSKDPWEIGADFLDEISHQWE